MSRSSHFAILLSDADRAERYDRHIVSRVARVPFLSLDPPMFIQVLAFLASSE
jgi:hypothetical protein